LFERKNSKVAVVCDASGQIRSVVQDELASQLQVRVGSPLSMLFLPEDMSRLRRFVRTVATRGGAFGRQLNVVTRSGPVLMSFAGVRLTPDTLLVAGASTPEVLLTLLDSYFSPTLVRGPTEQPQDTSVVLDELTRVNSELVNLQRELAKRNVILEAVTKQRNELLATAAHDLRTPLTVVKGYCQLLVAQLGGERAVMARRVGDAVEYALEILAQSLEYARLETHAPLSLAAVDLAHVAHAVTELHRPLAVAKQIELRVRIGSGVPPLRLDRVKIQQALSNLLLNAIKYSPSGSAVEVDVGHAEREAWVRITDHGVGIAATEIPLLFRPFQRTSSRPTAGESSTGLGLAIARKLVQAHGGTIAVCSELAHGTVFSVHIPYDDRVRKARARTSEPEPMAAQETAP